MATTRASTSHKDTIVYEEKVTPKGGHFYLPYYVGRLLGRGGFANCHEVKVENDNTKYAIKIVPKEEDPKKKEESLAKIREEINILKSLNHPGIVKYYTDFQDVRNSYIVMELCKGGSLSDIIKKRKTLTEVEVRYFLVQMVEIMRYIQTKNIIHRDIKLANYFLDENYKLKLGDFGLATEYNDVFKTRRKFCGTPNYIAPEIIQRKAYGFEVDAWSTGVLMFTMLFGGPPFETKNCKETYEKITSCSFKFPVGKECSEAAKDFIQRLLCLSPNERLKFEHFMDHPFICNYTIPKQLEPSFPATPPGKAFAKQYGKAIGSKKLEPRPQKEIVFMTPQKVTRKASSKQIRPATKAEGRVTYRNALRGGPVKLMQIAYQPLEEAEPAVKIEENLCKQEQQLAPPVAELDIIKKQEGLPEAFPIPIENCEKSVHKKEEPEDDEEEDSSTNLKGRKKFQANNHNMAVGEIERTQKKTRVKEQKLVLFASSEQRENDDWDCPKLRLRLKQTSPISEQKELKIVHWQKCARQIGIAYILTNHQIGIYFQDSDCMQISSKNGIIHYIFRGEGQAIHREIRLNEVEQLRESDTNLYAKVQILLHYNRILRNKLPQLDKIEHENTAASLGDRGTAITPVSVKSVGKGEGILTFTLTNSNVQFFFNDNTSMYFSITSYTLSYRVEGNLIVHSIPLSKNLESAFDEKVKVVCRHYNKLAKVRPGEGSECWLLKQEKHKLTPKKVQA